MLYNAVCHYAELQTAQQ